MKIFKKDDFHMKNEEKRWQMDLKRWQSSFSFFLCKNLLEKSGKVHISFSIAFVDNKEITYAQFTFGLLYVIFELLYKLMLCRIFLVEVAFSIKLHLSWLPYAKWFNSSWNNTYIEINRNTLLFTEFFFFKKTMCSIGLFFK